MRTAAALAVLLALSAGLYWKLTFSSRYTWLENPDQALQVRPWLDYAARELHAGRIPLWDPYERGGQSLIGQVQPGLANPLNWPLFAMPLDYSSGQGHIPIAVLDWYWVLIHWLAAAFAYWLCRDLGAGHIAAVAGAAVFAFTGFVGHAGTPQFLMSAVWLPVILLFLARLWRGYRPLASAALGGAALGLAFLSGHHNIATYMAVLAVAAVALCRYRIAALPLFLLLAALVSAVQVLPAVEYGRQALRWAGNGTPQQWNERVPYTVHAAYSLGLSGLAGFVIPGLGQHADPFIGVVALALAAAAMRLGWNRRDVRLLALLALAALLLALGEDTPLHRLAYWTIPFVEKARYPAMAIAICQAALAGLAALGAQLAFAERRAVERTLLLPLTIAGGAGLAVYGWLHFHHTIPADHPAWVVGLAALAMAAALRWLPRGGPWVAVAALALIMLQAAIYPPPILRPREFPGSYASMMAAQSDIATFLKSRPGWFRVAFDDSLVPYNFGDFYGIEQFDGYVASMPARFYQALGDKHTLRDYGVRYRVAAAPSRPWEVEVFRSRGGLRVFQDPDAGEPVWAVHDAGCTGADRLSVVSRAPEFPVFEAVMACPGLVVAGDPWFRGWRAFVDGRRVPIQEYGNGVRAVRAAAGQHRIEFRYRPASVFWGAGLTLLGLCLAAAVSLRSVKAHTNAVPAVAPGPAGR